MTIRVRTSPIRWVLGRMFVIIFFLESGEDGERNEKDLDCGSIRNK